MSGLRQGAKGAESPPNLIQGDYYMGKGVFIDVPRSRLKYFSALKTCLERTDITGNLPDETFEVDPGLKAMEDMMRAAHKAGGKVIFIGNGGSAAVASHMAVDYSKNKGIRAVALNDAAMLTCLANDYGYENVFAKQIEYQGRKADVAVIVSSSGRSLNIIAAANEARARGLRGVVTLSGMNPNNKLRKLGNLNFYVPCTDYGLVELAHLALLHSVASVA